MRESGKQIFRRRSAFRSTPLKMTGEVFSFSLTFREVSTKAPRGYCTRCTGNAFSGLYKGCESLFSLKTASASIIMKHPGRPAFLLAWRLDAVTGGPFAGDVRQQPVYAHDQQDRQQQIQQQRSSVHSLFSPLRLLFPADASSYTAVILLAHAHVSIFHAARRRIFPPESNTPPVSRRGIHQRKNQNFRLLILMEGPMVLLMYSDLM